ncbi:MAG: class I SAM-dependent methyltransferase [Geobacteraceae bacterium]|nr:class I SAM-dependent methyltransferase [Geobacteraceae bacterium]
MTSSTEDIYQLRGPVALAHLILRRFINQGDHVIDATCGNGHDTLLLADLTGKSGRVWAFDIQEEALAATRTRLRQSGVEDRVTLLKAGHETIREFVSELVSAVVFNLGYLPAGDRTIVTRPDTTVTALEQALDLLATGGVVTVAVYPGHDGGLNESRMIESWASGLDAKKFHTWRMGQTNVPSEAPYLVVIQKAN